jgi:hypothetical protein
VKTKRSKTRKEYELQRKELDKSVESVDIKDISVKRFDLDKSSSTERTKVRLDDGIDEIDIDVSNIRDDSYDFIRSVKNDVYATILTVEKNNIERTYITALTEDEEEANKSKKIIKNLKSKRNLTSKFDGNKLKYGKETQIEKYIPININSIDTESDVFIGMATILLVLSFVSLVLLGVTILVLSIIWSFIYYISNNSYDGYMVDISNESERGDIKAMLCKMYRDDDELIIESEETDNTWTFDITNGTVCNKGQEVIKEMESLGNSKYIVPVVDSPDRTRILT